jgi:hypothetical protein
MRILRGLGSQALPCGCLVGVYETYATQTVAVIDAKGTGCQDRTHRVNASVDPRVAFGDRPQPPSTMPTMSR